MKKTLIPLSVGNYESASDVSELLESRLLIDTGIVSVKVAPNFYITDSYGTTYIRLSSSNNSLTSDSFGVDFVLDTFASSIFIPILKNRIPPAILKAYTVIP